MGSLCGLAQQMFEFGEDLFDRIEIGTVGRQEQEACAAGPDGGPDGGFFVAGEVVENDNVAWPQRWTEFFLDPLGEARAVDRLIEDEGRIDPVVAQCGNEGHRLPMAVRHLGIEALPFG